MFEEIAKNEAKGMTGWQERLKISSRAHIGKCMPQNRAKVYHTTTTSSVSACLKTEQRYTTPPQLHQ